MHSEWLKVMLEEIERKRVEAERARRETELRRQDSVPGQPARGVRAGRGRSERRGGS